MKINSNTPIILLTCIGAFAVGSVAYLYVKSITQDYLLAVFSWLSVAAIIIVPFLSVQNMRLREKVMGSTDPNLKESQERLRHPALPAGEAPVANAVELFEAAEDADEIYELEEVDGEETTTDGVRLMPSALSDPNIRCFFDCLVEDNILREGYMVPNGIKNIQLAYIVITIHSIMNTGTISWKEFERFWNVKNLRDNYNTYIKRESGIPNKASIDDALVKAEERSVIIRNSGKFQKWKKMTFRKSVFDD